MSSKSAGINIDRLIASARRGAPMLSRSMSEVAGRGVR